MIERPAFRKSFPDPRTVIGPDGRLDLEKAARLAWRPAWSIRSRRGSVAPFVEMLKGWWRALCRR